MRIPILSARPGWHIDQLRRAFLERGHEIIEVGYSELVAHHGGGESGFNDRLEESPLVLTRIIPDGSLEQIVRRVNRLHELEARGVRVINAGRAIERTIDKGWTTALLAERGLPTPETVVCESAAEAMRAFREMGDVVIKPLFGSMGLGIVRVTDEQTAWRVIRAVERIGGVFYVQRTIRHAGFDVRAFVIGGRVVAAISRHATDWCTSYARGAEPRPYRLTRRQEELALAATVAVEADYAGVDLIADEAGNDFVIEVNGVPGWRGLHLATGIDVAGAIADYALTAVRGKQSDPAIG